MHGARQVWFHGILGELRFPYAWCKIGDLARRVFTDALQLAAAGPRGDRLALGVG